MWQYWWWFWFTYYMCLYYFIFVRLIRQRTLKFSPKIVTSQKAHGKWGDFIICFVPIAWCANILSNSNFIMRMIEWQTESSLFTVRIRGRQWYWVYKIELRDLMRATSTAKNIGHDYWESFENTNPSSVAQNLNSLQIRAHNKEYLDAYKKTIKPATTRHTTYSNTVYTPAVADVSVFKSHPSFFSEAAPVVKVGKNQWSEANRLVRSSFVEWEPSEKAYRDNLFSAERAPTTSAAIPFNTQNPNKRFLRSRNFAMPAHLTVPNDLEPRWTSSASELSSKTTADNLYFVIKQKRFAAPIKKINTVPTELRKPQLVLNSFSALTLGNEFDYTRKWSAKRLKYKSSVIPLAYNRRLLRTRRVLVLPSQVNITLITNSFDVVHSWYIPGLGVKLDCIPGRSTHHTIFIDHAGFYYGQCAEICGRYHHHMPIRVCALPFEHFLVWWYHYGLPYFNATAVSRKASTKSGIKQYSW